MNFGLTERALVYRAHRQRRAARRPKARGGIVRTQPLMSERDVTEWFIPLPPGPSHWIAVARQPGITFTCKHCLAAI